MVSEGRKIEDETRGGKYGRPESRGLWQENAAHRHEDDRVRGLQALNLPANPTSSA